MKNNFLKRIFSICLCTFMLCTMIFVPEVGAEGAEMLKYYNNGSTLDDAWSYSNLQVMDDVIGTANYNNGGKMIGLPTAGEFDVVYKVPEGRSFESFFTEISTQNINDAVKIAYSEDGISFTDFDFKWTQGSRPQPTNDGTNAYYSWKWSTMVTAPEGIDVKFIKIYYNVTRAYEFFLRKVSMLTGGSAVSGNVTDSMSGAEKLNYEISNFMPYDLYCYNNNRTEASEIATKKDKFGDSDLLVVRDLTKEAYVTYKAADGQVFTSVQVDQIIRDSGANDVNIKVSASKDGVVYDDITPTKTSNGYIHSSTASGAPGACWNAHWVLKASFNRMTGYKFIKLTQPANAVAHPTNGPSANIYKLASVALTTETIPLAPPRLYEVYEDYFDISVAIEPRDAELYPELMENQFNVIVPENQMKSWIHRGENDWYWQGADAIVDYATQNGKKVRAHTLVYPTSFDNYRANENAWFYKDENGNSLLDANNNVIDLEKANELTLKRLENHIKTIMTRYKGKVYAYDVVNEAFMENGAERTYLEFVKLLEGTDWITKCFEWAHEADPDAVLIYNDNGFTNDIAKQDVIYNMIKGLRDKGIPVQIGMQMHYSAMTDLGLVENVLERFSGLCDIYVTELDMRLTQSVITDESEVVAEGTTAGTVRSVFETITYPDYMYDEAMEIQARKYGSLFDLFRKYADSIKCVGFWNSCDGRFYDGTEKYALPFDENGEPKAAFYRIIDLEKKLPRWQESDKLPQYRRFDYEIDKNTHTVLVRGNAESSATATAVLLNPDGTENGRAETSANGEFSLEIPINTAQIPSGTVPEYTLKLKIGNANELSEKFTYYTPAQQAQYYILHDDLSNFSKTHSYFNVGLESNHTFFEDDTCGMRMSSTQLDESYVTYKIPDEKNVSKITVDSYIFTTVSGSEYPEIYGSTDGKNYGRISDNGDWIKLDKTLHTDVYQANSRHHYKIELDDIPDGIKYVKISLEQFSDWWYMNIADVVIETENDPSYTNPDVAELSAEGISLYAKTQRGEVLTPYLHEGSFVGKATVKNNSEAEKSVLLLSAQKSGNELLYADSDAQRLGPGEEKELSVQFGKIDKESALHEAFLFDMSKGLIPLMDKDRYEIK